MKNRLIQFLIALPLIAQLSMGAYFPTIGFMTVVNDTFTRPANTTAYSANYAVAAATTDTGTTVLRSLGVARVNGGSGYITGIRVWTGHTGISPRIRVHFYSTNAPPTAVPGDGSGMTVMFANAAYRIGHYDLPAMNSGTSGSDASWSSDISLRMPFVCWSGTTNLYYRLETLDAFTPASGDNWFISVAVEQN